MSNLSILGLYDNPDSAADALDALHDSGFDSNDFDVLTGTPYPEGAFGEHVPQHRLFRFPLFGAIMGLTLSVFLTTTTQIVYPLITGGKPILSIFAMLVIMYEMTMLSAVVTTVIGILFESRLPDISMNVYDTRITEGLIGVSLVCSTDKKDIAEKALKDAGAMEIKSWENKLKNKNFKFNKFHIILASLFALILLPNLPKWYYSKRNLSNRNFFRNALFSSL